MKEFFALLGWWLRSWLEPAGSESTWQQRK
jgi:hypothetical protein